MAKLMTRDQQLRNFVAKNQHVPFAWGYHDCVLFAAKWMDCATGTSHVDAWRGTYSSPYSAKQMIKKNFGQFENIFDSFLKPVPHQLARTGDIAIVCGRDMKPTHGIIDSDKILMAGERGIVVHSRNQIVLDRAWRVE